MNKDLRKSFAGKLEVFTNQLSHEEQAMYREVLGRGGMTEAEIAKVSPGQTPSKASLVGQTAQLNAKFFYRLLDW